MPSRQGSAPHPGSAAAIAIGCTCPTDRNFDGDRRRQRLLGAWISLDCPVHGPDADVVDVTITTRSLEPGSDQ